MNLKKRISAVGIVFWLLGCVIVTGIEQQIQYKSSDAAMVYLINGSQGGNGSIFRMEKDNIIIVTTYHLLQDSESVQVYFPNWSTTNDIAISNYSNAEGTVILTNKEHDVGFVKVDAKQIGSEIKKNLKKILYNEKAYKLLEAGDAMEYCYLKWNNGVMSVVTQKGSIGHKNWYVKELKDYLIYNYCDVEPGMSGCAAVAEDGSYIGMMIGGNLNESGALSIQVIEKIYEDIE